METRVLGFKGLDPVDKNFIKTLLGISVDYLNSFNQDILFAVSYIAKSLMYEKFYEQNFYDHRFDR